MNNFTLVARSFLYERSCCTSTCTSANFRFLLPTASQCKKFKQVRLLQIVFRCPHHLQIESPPHIHFLCCRKPTKNSPYKLICTTSLHNQKMWFFAPHCLSVQKSSNDFDYAKLCSGVPTTCKKNYDSICIH